MDFKDNLRKSRFDANISQEALAERMSVSRQTISKWENGDAYPSTAHIFMLAKILNCNLDNFISHDVASTNHQPSKSDIPKASGNVTPATKTIASKSKHHIYWILALTATLAITLFLCLTNFNIKINHDSAIESQKTAVFDQIIDQTIDEAISKNGYMKKEIVGYGIEASTGVFFVKCNLEGSTSPCSAIIYFCKKNGKYECEYQYLDDPDYLPKGEYHEIG